MKRAWPWFLLAALAIFDLVTLPHRACSGPDPANWVAKAKYDADLNARDTKLDASLAVISEKDALIARKDEDLAVRDKRIAAIQAQADQSASERDALSKETAALKADAAAAIAANPAVKRLVDNLEFRIAASERQVFSLSALVEEERGAKADWMAKFEAARIQRDEYKLALGREIALREGCQGLVADLERMAPASAFERAAADAEEAGIGVYAAIRYKDPVPLASFLARKGVVKVWRLLHR